MNVIITAIIKAKPSFKEEVHSTLLNMVEQTRKEEACILYDLHQDLSDTNTFIFYEIWQDQEGLDKHNQQPYIKEFGSLIKSHLQEQPQIYLTKKN
ncbi:putative quinol monooxygenase [Myroides sp.]|uniref:putative quinol monooxygenase n=1 Tax=Myroides sp. TaxID=1874736 RepID=UPI003F31654F